MMNLTRPVALCCNAMDESLISANLWPVWLRTKRHTNAAEMKTVSLTPVKLAVFSLPLPYAPTACRRVSSRLPSNR